jgi:hypothetical protein
VAQSLHFRRRNRLICSKPNYFSCSAITSSLRKRNHKLNVWNICPPVRLAAVWRIEFNVPRPVAFHRLPRPAERRPADHKAITVRNFDQFCKVPVFVNDADDDASADLFWWRNKIALQLGYQRGRARRRDLPSGQAERRRHHWPATGAQKPDPDQCRG